MLQALRDNMKGTVAAFIVALLVIPFVFFGVDSLFTSRGAPGEVAEVNGNSISERELLQALTIQRQQILSQYGDQVPAEFYSDERLREPLLNSLIQREVLVDLAESSGMAVSTSVTDSMITSSESFHDNDGKFDADLFVERLRRIGYTPRTYRDAITKDTLVNQLTSGIRQSAFVTDSELNSLLSLSRQTRDFSYLALPIADFEKSVQVSDEEVESYYNANTDQFMNPERVQVNYLDVSVDSLMSRVSVDEKLVLAQYEKEVSEYSAKTERKVGHILIEPKDDGSDQDLIEKVRQRMAAGDSFESLAKEFSDDVVSREAGGELGFFVEGAFPEEFEQAVKKLSVGEVSDVVETEAGFHFIKLVEMTTQEAPSFEESKDRIQEALQKAQASSLLADILTRLGELTFNSDGLRDAAEELDLTIMVSDFFTRTEGSGIAANAAVRNAAYSEEVLADGHNSQVLELSPDHVVVLRVKEYLPEAVKPLSEVAQSVSAQLLKEKAEAGLAEKATILADKLRNGADIELLAKEFAVEWHISTATERNNPGLDRQLLAGIFDLPKPTEGSVVSSIPLSNGDYAIVNLTQVAAGDISTITPEQRLALRAQLQQNSGGSSLLAFTAFNQANADIVIR